MITKTDLVDQMVAKHGRNFSKNTMAVLIDDVFGCVAQELGVGSEVRIHGFGTFSTTERKATTCRNPRTGEAIEIAAKRGVKFKAAKGLNDAVAE